MIACDVTPAVVGMEVQKRGDSMNFAYENFYYKNFDLKHDKPGLLFRSEELSIF